MKTIFALFAEFCKAELCQYSMVEMYGLPGTGSTGIHSRFLSLHFKALRYLSLGVFLIHASDVLQPWPLKDTNRSFWTICRVTLSWHI